MSNDTDRESIVLAKVVLEVTFILGLVATSTLFLLNSWSLGAFLRKRYEKNQFTWRLLKDARHAWRFPLFVASLCGMIIFAADVAMIDIDWTGNQAGCSSMNVLLILLFIFLKQSLGLVLYHRAKIVHDCLQMGEQESRILTRTRTILFYTLIFGVAIGFYWSGPVAFPGVIVLPEGHCALYSFIPIVTVVFAVADAVLAGVLLFIFLYPLYQHRQRMKATLGVSVTKGITQKLEKIVRHNVVCSSVGLLSSVVALATQAGLNWIAVEDPSSNSDHLRVWVVYPGACDILIALLA